MGDSLIAKNIQRVIGIFIIIVNNYVKVKVNHGLTIGKHHKYSLEVWRDKRWARNYVN
jgi:hypothetical protein